MTGAEIISMFELYVDDTSELSSSEELALCNRIYKKVCRNRPWEFLKKSASGTLSASVDYVALPSDFAYMAENNQKTDISIGGSNSVSKVVFVGSDYRAYKVINFSDRRQYRDNDGYCYIDIANSRLVFTKQPSALAYEFDYVSIPADLTTGTSPLLPDNHEIIAYGMATDSFIIQQFPKAQSYQAENQLKYNEALKDLAYSNANLNCN